MVTRKNISNVFVGTFTGLLIVAMALTIITFTTPVNAQVLYNFKCITQEVVRGRIKQEAVLAFLQSSDHAGSMVIEKSIFKGPAPFAYDFMEVWFGLADGTIQVMFYREKCIIFIHTVLSAVPNSKGPPELLTLT